MKILDRYLLRQSMRPMGATILVSLLALLAERALSVVDLVIGWRGSLLVVFEMLSYLIPHYMGLALPAAFFIGILFAYARLSREAELDAMNAGGFGLVQMVRPLAWAALAVALLHVLLVGYLQPYSRYAYRASVHAVTNVSFQSLIQADRFVTLGGTTYTVDSIDDTGSRFGRIFLYSAADERGDVIVTAREGEVIDHGIMRPLELLLQDGVQQILPRAGAAETGTPTALTLKFRRFTTDLRGREPDIFRPRGEDERELTLDELLFDRTFADGIQPVEVEAELNGRVVRSLSILVLPFLALPLSLGRRRAQRSYGFIVGITILVIYNQIVKTGEGLVDNGVTPAALGLWLPFAIFTSLSLAAFFRTAWKVPDPARHRGFDRMIELLQRLVARRLPSAS
ncbi:MAG: LptF/LptG family permease [Geminicoccaceae bacterium]|nr:LptF/LptG family permease [Geminicoccaceae bacterium]